jgi:hypothetical protein
MKLNKFLILGCLCLSLCGCSIYGDDVENIEQNSKENTEKTKIAQHIDEVFDVSSFHNLSDEQKAFLESDFDKIEDISFTQHSNGREVELYASKDLKGAYVIYDGEWGNWILPFNTQLAECDELYDRLDNTAFIPQSYERGMNGNGIIKCENKEYSIMDFNGYTMFSINYSDVDIEAENMPMKVLVYEKDGKAERIEIVSVCTALTNKFSQKNIDDVKELLNELGVEDGNYLAAELGQSLDKASYARKDSKLSVRSSRDVSRDKDIVYNAFTITLG